MKKLTIIQKCLICLMLFFCIGIFYIATVEANEPVSEPIEVVTSDNVVTVSHESGFYAEEVSLVIEGDTIVEAYYTLDGSDPSRENPTAFPYYDEVFIPKEENETVYTVRLIAYFEDGTTSNIISRTFITGDNVKTRYDVSVLSLAAPEEFFWGEEEGRFYSDRKYLFDGRENEKEIFMTLFDAEGNVLLSQNCGFRIHGNYSRAKNQPSFRLYARSEYDEQNDFEYVLFDNQYSAENTLIPEHKRLIIRNSGNDHGFAFIRSELASRLSLESGFPDAPCAKPVAVYLNNMYFGSYWIINNFDDTYYRETYGEYEGTMYTFEGGIDYLPIAEDETDETAIALIEDFNERMHFFAYCDLNDEENWAALNEYIDMENFLHYLAIHHYTSNVDTLRNNFKVYRYVAPEGGSYVSDSVFDGRYRFLLFDMDYCFGYVHNGAVWASVDHMTTTYRMESDREYYRFFQNLMRREDYREKYIRCILSMQNYYFSYEYAVPILDEMHASRENELRYTYMTTDLLINNDSAPDITCDEDIERALDDVRNFLRNRKDYVVQDLSDSFGTFTTYNLFLQNPENANITLDYATVSESSFEGMYYKEVPLTITAEAKPGYVFDYWLINGEKFEEASFDVTQSMIADGSLELECICSQGQAGQVYITSFKSNAGNDYIVLSNLGTMPCYLNNYYLTDDDRWNKSSLPAVKLEGGDSIIVYCNNYTELDALGKPYVNFNLQEGESLSLYRAGQIQLQTVGVPSLGTEEGIYTMDMQTGEFRETF